jgi:hypothetical protein
MERAAHIAGVADTFLNLYAGEGATYQKHFRECLVKARMNPIQLADNVAAFAETRPEVQRGVVVGALDGYLRQLCGPPP